MPVLAPAITPFEAEALLDKAARCRRLARLSTDARVTEALIALAAECETRAGMKVG